jgi:hypothetical protein
MDPPTLEIPAGLVVEAVAVREEQPAGPEDASPAQEPLFSRD